MELNVKDTQGVEAVIVLNPRNPTGNGVNVMTVKEYQDRRVTSVAMDKISTRKLINMLIDTL